MLLEECVRPSQVDHQQHILVRPQVGMPQVPSP